MSQETETRWQFAQSFSTEFKTSYTDLEARIKNAPSSSDANGIQALAAEVAVLSKKLSDAVEILPSYDQRQHELQVKALEKSIEQLRAESKTKTKFAFKKKPPATTNPTPSPSQKTDIALGTGREESTSSHRILGSRENAYLGWQSLPKSSEESTSADMTICDLKSCIVNLQATSTTFQITALHIRNLNNCVLLLPEISGSVLLHDLHRCTVVVGCHQFRMHTSTDVDVFVSIAPSPVIEGCERIRFAPRAPPKTINVQDFSHIRATPSPHWSFLPDSRPQPVIDAGIDSEQVSELLPKFLPPAPGVPHS